jgi:hypothetical protein
LHEKEKKKKNDCTVLFPGGFGRHLTADEFTQLLQEQSERKEAETAEKAQRTEVRETRRLAKAALEAGWKEMKARHQQALEAWEADCEQLRRNGATARNLPKKPKRPPKPKPVVDEPERSGEHESSDEDSD